jgi:type I restriction enzyme, S subunit
MSIDDGDKGSWSAEHLPPTWGWASFNEFWSDHTDSKRKIPQNSYLTEGVFPVIDQGSNLIGGYANDGAKKSLAPLPVIIFGDHTRTAKYFDRPFIQGADGVRVLCAAHGVDPLFAYHALRCVELPDKGYSRHFKFLKATQFPLAPLSEQHRIVAKIDGLATKSQRARGHLDHIPRLVEKYKQAILKAAFSGELTPEWRATHATKTSGVVDRHGSLIDARLSELPDLPENWRWQAISEVMGISGGLTKNPKRSAMAMRRSYLRVANVYANELRLAEIAETGCTEKEFEKTKLVPGDLLIVEGNGSLEQIGRVAIWNGEVRGCSHQNHLIRARPSEIVEPRYALFWLLSPAGREAIEAVASSSSGLHTLSITKVGGLPIPLCGKPEQIAIVRLIESAFAWIDRLASETSSARKLIDHLDKAILAKAFRGELVPQDPNDEPAAMLLERISAERKVTSTVKRPTTRKK